MPQKPVELRTLTALRFVAAFAIFCFHVRIHFSGAVPFDAAVLNGAAFMSLFFCLSGFVLSYSYAHQSIDLKTFAVRRLARIAPTYFLAGALSIFVIEPGGDTPFAAVCNFALIVALCALFLQAWFPPLFERVNNGSWSISVEMFLYACFPIALPWMLAAPTKTLWRTLAISCIAAAAPGAVYVMLGGPYIYYSVPIYRLPEFVAGCTAGVLFAKGYSLPRPLLWLVIAGALLFISLLEMPHLVVQVHGSFAYIPCFIFIILALASLEREVGGAFIPKILVFLGNASYCFYSFAALVMVPLIMVKQARPDLATVFTGRYVFPAALAALLVISSVVHVFFEEPLRRFISTRFATPRDGGRRSLATTT
jgi:peptidoglycan/LPS O-acetylase OafA/YrhL